MKRKEGETPGEWVKRVATKDSGWLEKAKWRHENRHWLRISQSIALCILDYMDHKGLTHEDMSKALGITFDEFRVILQGRENLSLQTIANIQEVLGEKVIIVPSTEKVCRICDENPVEYGEVFCIPCEKTLGL